MAEGTWSYRKNKQMLPGIIWVWPFVFLFPSLESLSPDQQSNTKKRRHQQEQRPNYVSNRFYRNVTGTEQDHRTQHHEETGTDTKTRNSRRRRRTELIQRRYEIGQEEENNVPEQRKKKKKGPENSSNVNKAHFGD